MKSTLSFWAYLPKIVVSYSCRTLLVKQLEKKLRVLLKQVQESPLIFALTHLKSASNGMS